MEQTCSALALRPTQRELVIAWRNVAFLRWSGWLWRRLSVWFKALFVGVDLWPQSDLWENKRSTAAEVIRETRCQMLMLGNIYSTNALANGETYRGERRHVRKAPVPALQTYHYCQLSKTKHINVYVPAHSCKAPVLTDFTRTEDGPFPEVLWGWEWEMLQRWLANTTGVKARMRYNGLYLFSGLLNEVTQVVLLNTFPISIMNHLLLIIPVQPRGLAFIQGNGLCVCTRACATSAQRTGRGGWIQPRWQTESRLFNEKVDERWHSLATSHTDNPLSFFTALTLPLRRAEQALSSHQK